MGGVPGKKSRGEYSSPAGRTIIFIRPSLVDPNRQDNMIRILCLLSSWLTQYRPVQGVNPPPHGAIQIILRMLSLTVFICMAAFPCARPLEATEWNRWVQDGVDQTRALGSQWLDKAKEAGGKARDLGKQALQHTQQEWRAIQDPDASSATPQDPDTEANRLRDIWNRALPELKEATQTAQRMETAPRFALLGPTRNALQTEYARILDGLIIILEDRGLTDYQNRIAALEEKIRQARRTIQTIRETRQGASFEDQARHTADIITLEQHIQDDQAAIAQLRHHFAAQLARMGLQLTDEQIEVLLTRVDGADIIRMAVVFDTIKEITRQLMALTQESGEDLTFAKRYYAMHVVLLDLLLHMQDTYIQQIEQGYQPRLETLRTRTQAINRTAQAEHDRETHPTRRASYEANMRAHQLTLQTVQLYVDVLNSQLAKVREARGRLERERTLAQNTLDTVMVSAELVSLLNTSQASFETLTRLQMPELVPFENLALQKKFQELSTLLAQ
jgi:hypothetical protein